MELAVAHDAPISPQRVRDPASMGRVHTACVREDMTPELRASYAACRRVHRRHDPTYYWATRRLPADVRPAVHAVYAFVRSADELVDGPGRAADPDARRAALDGLEDALREARAGGASPDPTVAALADAGARHDLPLDELDVYMRSMRIDCAPVRIGVVGRAGRLHGRQRRGGGPDHGAAAGRRRVGRQLRLAGPGLPADQLHPRRARGLRAGPDLPAGHRRGRAGRGHRQRRLQGRAGRAGGAGAASCSPRARRRWARCSRACARACGWPAPSTCACWTASSGWTTTCSAAAPGLRAVGGRGRGAGLRWRRRDRPGHPRAAPSARRSSAPAPTC